MRFLIPEKMHTLKLALKTWIKRNAYMVSLCKDLQYLFFILSGRRKHASESIRHPLKSRPFQRISYSQQGEDLVLDRILSKVVRWDKSFSTQRIYVDVGAWHPVDSSVTYRLYLDGWSGISFDPSKRSLKAFDFFRPRSIFVNSIVGRDDDCFVPFYVPTASSENHHQHCTKVPDSTINYKCIEHHQVSLCKELERLNVSRIDLLNIDVEGAELEILESIDFNLYRPGVISVEIHGNRISDCLDSDIAKFLKDKGYIAVASAVITYFFVHENEFA